MLQHCGDDVFPLTAVPVVDDNDGLPVRICSYDFFIFIFWLS